jgi:basic amino acid/polyamine antiporter, APA family
MAPSRFRQLTKTKSFETLRSEAASDQGLRRVLSATNLVSLGVGGIIGAGIFVITGQAAAQYAGPGIALSFVISGIGCLFAGLCYAEYAAMIPIAGSAYTYAYATLGEFIAWIIGWDLILEYLFSASAVAVGWGGYLQNFLREFGLRVPSALADGPFSIVQGHWVVTGALFNLPAATIVLLLSGLLVIGIRESATFNHLMVVTKVSVLLAFIGFGLWYFRQHPGVAMKNWTPFVPPNTGTFGEFGWSGLFKGAGVIFFAYIGFDSVSTAAQESRNPQRDMPIGILGSLGICTVIFVAVSLVLTGLVSYTRLQVDAPVVYALQLVGAPRILRLIVGIAALAGLSSVILVMLMGQPRIFFSMANDGLLPPLFAKIHPRFRTPYVTTMIVGGIAAVCAGLLPLAVLGKLVSIGTLFAFVLVCLGILVLRRTRADLPRPFRTPWVPLVPILGALICFVQMLALPADTWLRLLVWLGLGLVVYFGYGRRHSKLRA